MTNSEALGKGVGGVRCCQCKSRAGRAVGEVPCSVQEAFRVLGDGSGRVQGAFRVLSPGPCRVFFTPPGSGGAWSLSASHGGGARVVWGA